MLSALNDFIKYMEDGLEKFRFSDTALYIYDFFWHTFCDWYIEISKIELTAEGNGEYANIVKNVLLKVLKESLIVMHPFIPFITEEVYSNLPAGVKKESIMMESWPVVSAELSFDKKELSDMDDLMRIIYTVRNLRGELDFSPAVKVDVFLKLESGPGITEKYANIIKTLAKVENISGAAGPSCITRQIVSTGAAVIGTAGIDKSAIPDRAKVIAGREKRLADIEKGMVSVSNKLNNPNFVNNAMKKAVEEEKARLVSYEAEKKALLDFIADLKK
jgi:valyl-tRNA synthetase